MNLLFVEERPRFIGGSERMSLALCRHAIARGHHAFLAHAEPGDMVGAYAASGAKVTRLPVRPLAVRQPLQAWRSVRALARIAAEEKIDWIFTSQVSYVSLLALAGRLSGAGTAVHLGLAYDFPSPLFRFGQRRIHLGVAPSAHTATAWLLRGWPPESLQIIPNGVDLEVFRPSGDRATARQKLAAIPSGQPLVTYVGRLVGEKGIFTLLRAFAAYRRTAGNGFLLLAGHAAADEVAALHRLATELGLPADAWRVQTATDRPEEIYRAADIAVTPSEWDEPFGLAPLEAMACGAFALVSDRGVLPSFVASIGQECVFPAGDATALARRLSMWLGNPAAREGAAKQLMENTRREYAFATCGDAYLEAFANRPPT